MSGTHRVMDALILVVFVLGLPRDTMFPPKCYCGDLLDMFSYCGSM